MKICLVPQIGYFSNVDKRGEKTENQKQKTEEKQKKRKAEAIEHEMNLNHHQLTFFMTAKRIIIF